MSNEAQALAGPPESPGETEYKAFLAVLSSSARGRAFLAEHARRSRQAETEMLLGALARIETTLAEQRERTAPPAPPQQSSPPPATTALAAIAAKAMAAAESDVPEVKVIKAGSMPAPPQFAGEDFAGAVPPAPMLRNPAAESNVIADTVPPEDPLAPPGAEKTVRPDGPPRGAPRAWGRAGLNCVQARLPV